MIVFKVVEITDLNSISDSPQSRTHIGLAIIFHPYKSGKSLSLNESEKIGITTDALLEDNCINGPGLGTDRSKRPIVLNSHLIVNVIGQSDSTMLFALVDVE